MGGVNLHNSHYYADANAHWHRYHRTQRRWVGIIGDYLVGSIFYEENLMVVFYLNILENEVPPLLDVPLVIRQNMWFQQDGATPRQFRPVRRFLNATYPNRWIGIGSQVHEFPPRSPDLPPLKSFFGEHLSNKFSPNLQQRRKT